jgi:enoyl-CoA hydratase/carnithine racemase
MSDTKKTEAAITMATPVDYSRDGGVVTITLNAPERHNGLAPDMVDALLAALDQLGADRDARCAILTGAGTSFSAGGDPKRMLAKGLYPDMSTAELRQFYKRGIQRLPLAFQDIDVPIIAAINGPAIGAGCDLACLCDLRIASDTATFASSFVKLGIIPGDGGAWLLPRLIGRANAMELLLTGDSIDAQTARAMGLISFIATYRQ